MNKHQLNAPPNSTHYRVLTTGETIYYHIDCAIFVFELGHWREIDTEIVLEGLIEL